MVTYYVKKNEAYKVTATVDCIIYNSTGGKIATCPAGTTLTFKANTDKISLSDYNAVIDRAVDDSNLNSGTVNEHVCDPNIHVTPEDKEKWNGTANSVTDELNNHVGDPIPHVSSSDRTQWNSVAQHTRDLTLHQRVVNVTELYPIGGDGEYPDRYSFNRAVLQMQSYMNTTGISISGGIKIAYKNTDGYFVEYIWSGNGELTDQSTWNGFTSTEHKKLDSLGAYCLVGETKNYAGSSVPEGWLLCDGSAVSRTEYADLFAVIGTLWGDGDGSSTFNLPNLIDRVAWGATTAGGYIEAGLPNIEGSFSITDGYTTPANLLIGNVSGAFSKETGDATSNFGTFDYSSNETNKLTKATLDASKSNEIYGKSSTVQPPAAKLIPIIKY